MSNFPPQSSKQAMQKIRDLEIETTGQKPVKSLVADGLPPTQTVPAEVTHPNHYMRGLLGAVIERDKLMLSATRTEVLALAALGRRNGLSRVGALYLRLGGET